MLWFIHVCIFICSVAELYEYALDPVHLASTDLTITNTTITDTGALSTSSGNRTGRVPKEKRIVEDSLTKDVRLDFSFPQLNWWMN